MPIRLSTTVQKIFSLPNKANSLLLSEFYEYMKSNDVSESHQNNNLKVLIAFARHLRSSNFIDIDTSDSIIIFLNTKLKSIEDDPDSKCITTWNDYLGRLKYSVTINGQQQGTEVHITENDEGPMSQQLSDPVTTASTEFVLPKGQIQDGQSFNVCIKSSRFSFYDQCKTGFNSFGKKAETVTFSIE